MSRGAAQRSAEWRSRTVLAWSIRAATVLIPFAAAVACMVLASRTVPRPGSTLGHLAWYVGLLGLSWLVARVVGRVVDRSLPLAALLEMSLTFPESAPSRLGLAQRGSSRTALDRLTVAPPDETAQAAAERILGLLTALSAHDRFTRGHAERVRAYADLIGERLEMSPGDRDRLGWAALLHDIGKLQVPAKLLSKAGKPTAAEWDVLKAHPAAGAEIAAPLLAWLSPMERVIVEHHERWDGSGYPAGLSGEGISYGARVVSVADSFEAMTAARPYSRPMRREAALRELVACAGSHFDPDVVRALLTVPQRRLAWAMGPAAWVAALPFAGQSSLTVVRTAAGHAGTMTAGATAVVVAAVGPTGVLDSGQALADATSTNHGMPSSTTAAPQRARTTRPPATSQHGKPGHVPGPADTSPLRPAPAVRPAPTTPGHNPSPAGPAHPRPTATKAVTTPTLPLPANGQPAIPARPVPGVPQPPHPGKPTPAAPGPAPAQPAKPPKPANSAKPPKPPKAAKPTKPAATAKPGKPAAPAKPAKSAKPGKPPKPAKAAPGASVKPAKPHGSKPTNPPPPAQPPAAAQPAGPTQPAPPPPAEPVQPPSPDKPDKPGKPAKPPHPH